MAKISKRFQGQNSDVAFEHQEIYDEWFLPDAMELARLKQVDPEIMKWIKERATKEQDIRHSSISERLSMIALAQSRAFKTDILTITYPFLLMGAGMFLSYVLLLQGQTIAGSMFGGSALLFSARAFLNFRRDQANQDHKS